MRIRAAGFGRARSRTAVEDADRCVLVEISVAFFITFPSDYPFHAGLESAVLEEERKLVD